MTDTESRTHYELLGLEPGVSAEEIKEAYREIARIFHPDSNFYDDIIEDTGPEDSDVFKAITAAYQVLINEEKRRKYDESLPKGLEDWGDSEESDRPRAYQASDIDSDTDDSQDEDIPEEWKEERKRFQAHFEEILKPGPKVNLVADEGRASTPTQSAADAFGTWEESQKAAQGLSRFGNLQGPIELPSLDKIPAPRRVIASSMAADPIQLIMYVGLPIMSLIVLCELFLLS
jgi:curved DNA-binding protein CbpA